MKKFFGVLIKAAAFFIGWIVCIERLPIIDSDILTVWRFNAELEPLLAIILLTFVFWRIDRKELHISILSRPLVNTTLGIGTGCAWLGMVVGILIWTGTMQFSGVNHVSMLWLWIFSAFLNVIMQELLVRGYLYQLIKSAYHVIPAAIITTALFTLMHGGAFEAGLVPVLNVVTMSLLMTAVLEYTKSLLAPIMIHFIWNAIGAIIFGGVSLADDYPNLIHTTFSGNSLLSGGSCKIEGSIVVLALNLAFTILFLGLNRRKLSKMCCLEPESSER